jgi:2-polyprenyl-3-methyl-5-hydroxy-6-metoxy-1,4-benzoquinol methylase
MESCYLCHSPEVIHRFDIGEYPLLHCKACGLEWLSPQPDDAVLGEIYGSQYHESRMQSAGVGYSAMKQKTFEAILAKVHLSSQATVLDIGCAEGDLLRVLQTAGHTVYGIDCSSYAAALCQKEFGLENIHCGELSEAPFSDVCFDAVFMIDVLEHTRDPIQILSNLQKYLKPNGKLVLVLPNVGGSLRKTMGKAWPHYLIEHLFYFSPKTIQYVLQKASFQEPLVRTFPKILSIEYIAGWFKTRRKGVFFTILGSALYFIPSVIRKRLWTIPCGQMLVIAQKK